MAQVGKKARELERHGARNHDVHAAGSGRCTERHQQCALTVSAAERVRRPNSVFVGSDAKFEVLFDGKPLADQLVSVHFGDERYSKKKLYAEIRTDAAGRFTVHPAAAGLYLAMTRLRVLPTSDGQPATSHTCSVTFEATD